MLTCVARSLKLNWFLSWGSPAEASEAGSPASACVHGTRAAVKSYPQMMDCQQNCTFDGSHLSTGLEACNQNPTTAKLSGGLDKRCVDLYGRSRRCCSTVLRGAPATLPALCRDQPALSGILQQEMVQAWLQPDDTRFCLQHQFSLFMPALQRSNKNLSTLCQYSHGMRRRSQGHWPHKVSHLNARSRGM